MPLHKMPFTRVEICLFSIVDKKLCVLLGVRERIPDENLRALPGGVIRTDLDIDLDAAVQRVALERLHTSLAHPKQQVTVGGKDMDPRDPWALSIVYRAIVRADAVKAKVGKRLRDLRWMPVQDLPSLALGHSRLVDQCLTGVRAEIERMEIPFHLLQSHFSLNEVQSLCDTIRGHAKDASRFRQQLHAAGLVKKANITVQGATGRPTEMYEVQR